MNLAAYAEKSLLESLADYSDAIDPRLAARLGDGGLWRPLGDEANDPCANILPTEDELRLARYECRRLAVTNEFAVNALENRVSYIVGTGHVYTVAPRKHSGASERLRRIVQTWLDDWMELNDWPERQQESARRLDRDGEVFLRVFPGHDGFTRLRFVEPGQIGAPANGVFDPQATFGIVTAPGDAESVEGYWIDGELVPATRVQHRKANVDRNVKRGLPLFFPVRKNLLRAEKLLRNMSIVAQVQAAIALIRKHERSPAGAVSSFVAGRADVSAPSGAGKTTNFQQIQPGQILDAPAHVDYQFPQAGIDPARYVVALQAELRAIASRLVMPEFMLTSDASNANYASTLVAEGPAVKMFQRCQATQKASDLKLIWLSIEEATRLGKLPPAALAHIEIQVEAPSAQVRDQAREVAVAQRLSDMGWLSAKTGAARFGLDLEQERANGATPRGAPS